MHLKLRVGGGVCSLKDSFPALDILTIRKLKGTLPCLRLSLRLVDLSSEKGD